MEHGRQQKRPEHGIFSSMWVQWQGAVLKIELDGEEPFLAKLHRADPVAGNASVHEIEPRSGELVGVREIEWPPSAGKVTVVRTPSHIGQHGSTGEARGHFSR